MTELEIIQHTPVIRLSIEQIKKLPEDDISRALGILFDMAKAGDMAMVAENPPGTTYEVCYDRDLGWALRPICQCHNEPRFIEAYYEWNSRDGELIADPKEG